MNPIANWPDWQKVVVGAIVLAVFYEVAPDPYGTYALWLVGLIIVFALIAKRGTLLAPTIVSQTGG